MALRARLVAPPPERREWKWHETQWTSLSSALFSRGERRMEADNYLASGYGLRLALESQDRAVSFGLLARVWQPGRLKGTQVSPAYGKPYLAATQVFDLRPVPRKWLSVEQINDVNALYVKPKQILVTRSGSVGRATLAYTAHEDTLISDDLLRVVPRRPEMWGWVYAYLRSRQARAMMSAAQYGHVIKHLEVSHLEALPIPVLRDDLLEGFNAKVGRIVELRNQAYTQQRETETMFETALGGPISSSEVETLSFNVFSSDLSGTRRRFEASFHNPTARALNKRFIERNLKVQLLSEVTQKVWWMTRFKRVFGDGGTPYFSADELFSVNAHSSKSVLLEQAENPKDYFVKTGWIVMACSGQVYGLNGSVALMTKWNEQAFFSHDFIRIVTSKEIRAGYLFTVLGHPTMGRPLVLRHAYGTSIPHLEPSDIQTFPVVRLGEELETQIGEQMEAAVNARAEADALENEIAAEAEVLINRFLAGEQGEFEALRLVAAPTKSLEPDPVTGFPPETDFERQMQEWRDNDLSHLGELPPFEWGEHGEPEVHPLRYVEGEGWVTS